jgi:hypothetical protein
MQNAVAIPRPALALLVAATVALGGCVEKRTVYRDNDNRRPRYSWNESRDDDWFRPGRGVVCNGNNNVCYKNGWPNRDATRKVFGKRAGRSGRWG